MGNPWEKYQAPATDGPWAKYSGQSSKASAPEEQGMGEQFARKVTDTLPAIGAVVGGVVGAGAGLLTGPAAVYSAPVGGVAGAGLGMAGGESLKNIINHYAFGDAQTVEDTFKKPLVAAKDGMMYEVGGQAIGQIPSLVKAGANGVKGLVAKQLGPSLEYTPIANKEAVEAAAKKLGIENVPKGFLTDNPTYQQLESGLSQSGSLPAKGIRENYNNFSKGLESATSKIADLKTPDSNFSLGTSIQKDIVDQVKANKAPTTELYNNVVPDLQKIPVNESVVNKVFGQLKKDPAFQTQQGQAFLNEHKDIVLQTPELASLKEVRSGLKDLVGPTSAPVDAKRVSALQDAITSIRNNSIEATKADLPKRMHAGVDDLLEKIALADSSHASNISDINSVKSLTGNKSFGSPSGFISKIGEMKESDLAQKASNLDVTTLKNLQQKFPSVFEKAKTAKINDMIQGSTNPSSGFSDVKFIKQYDNMSKEAKDLIFTPEIQSHIESVKTIKQAIPDKLGPSGTPGGQMMMDMFNPKRNALDYGIKKTLETATPKLELPADAAKVVQQMKATPKFQVLNGGGGTITKPVVFQNAAKNGQPSQNKTADQKQDEVPTKGPEKWASDGIEKVLDHDSSLDRSTIEELSRTKKGKELLIKASDLKPGSKAMDKLVGEIKDGAN